jgi:hypothetical protein
LTTTAEEPRRVPEDDDARDDEPEERSDGLRVAACSGAEQIRQFWRKRPWRQKVGKRPSVWQAAQEQ